MPVGRSGFFFFFLISFFFKQECTGGKLKKKSSRPIFSPPGRWTGNDFLFEDGLRSRQAVPTRRGLSAPRRHPRHHPTRGSYSGFLPPEVPSQTCCACASSPCVDNNVANQREGYKIRLGIKGQRGVAETGGGV